MNRTRQTGLIVAATILFPVFYLLRLMPGAAGNGLGLFIASLLVGCLFYLIAVRSTHSTVRRRILVAVPFTLIAILGLVLWPYFRRSMQQRRLEAIGAEINCRVGKCDSGWFRVGPLVVPCWTKSSLGDAFFGRIASVRLAQESVARLKDAEFPDDLELLILPKMRITRSDAQAIKDFVNVYTIDMRVCPVEQATLALLAETSSLRKIYINGDSITDEEIREIISHHTTLSIFVRRPDGLYRIKHGERDIYWKL